MIKQHEIVLNKPYHDVINLLKADNLQCSALDENGVCKFKLCKSITSLYDHRMFRYTISGVIKKTDPNVKVTYIIRPATPIYVVFAFLSVACIQSFIFFLLNTISPQFTMITALFIIVFGLQVLHQEKECKQAFEKKLRE